MEANPEGENLKTVPQAEYDTLKARADSLEQQHKSLQRELEKARQGGALQKDLQSRLDSVENLQLTILEQFEKLGIDNVKTADIVAEHRKKRGAEKEVDASMQRAGEMIVNSATAAGITDFEKAWQEERFATARQYWREGKHELAVSAFQAAAVKGEEKAGVYTEEQVKKRVEEERKAAVEAYVKERSTVVDTSSSSRAPTTANVEKLTLRLREINRLVEKGRDVSEFEKEVKDISNTLAGRS